MPDVLVKVASIVVLLGGLIFVHELGHFLVAKLLRVKVVRFSIGFGPRLFGFTRGETEYRIAALPLGGYVKMAGDDPTEEVAPEDVGRGFLEQAPWKRLVIALAGPVANLVFPGVIFISLFLAQNGNPVPAPVVGTVTPGSPAEQAGLRPGDRILSVAPPGGTAVPVRYHGDVRELVSPHPGEALTLRVERDGKELAQYFCFGRPVVSPAEGTVVALKSGYGDNVPGQVNPLEIFGNHVVIDHGSNEFSLLAHLKAGSVAVKVGQKVRAGEKIGLIGNSGASTEPHLHYQLMDGPDWKVAHGLPARFLRYLADGKAVESGEPRRLQLIAPGT